MAPAKGRRPRRVPQRTCVGCRNEQAKRELIRVVRTPAGPVVLDPTGRKNGRGAYVHQSRDCWEVALKRGALERALKTSLDPAARQALTEYASSLPTAPPPEPVAPAELASQPAKQEPEVRPTTNNL